MLRNAASQGKVPSQDVDLRISVLIASEVRLLGEGLAKALSRERSISVCGCSVDLSDAVRKIPLLKPDIVLLNATLQAGADIIHCARAMEPQVRVVALAITEEPQSVISWAEAGIAGYVPSTTALRDLVPFLADIMRGEQPCSARVAAGLLQRLHLTGRSASHTENHGPSRMPTARERQILEMICDGLSNKEIARHLNIGVATAKSHVHNLLGKLGLQRRSQAASWICGRNVAGASPPKYQPPSRPRA